MLCNYAILLTVDILTQLDDLSMRTAAENLGRTKQSLRPHFELPGASLRLPALTVQLPLAKGHREMARPRCATIPRNRSPRRPKFDNSPPLRSPLASAPDLRLPYHFVWGELRPDSTKLRLGWRHRRRVAGADRVCSSVSVRQWLVSQG